MNLLEAYIKEYGTEEEEVEKEAAPSVNLIQPKFQVPPPPGPPNLRDQKKKETEMWHAWNNGGRKPQDLRPLLTSMRPLIQDSVNTWRGRVRAMPEEALEAEFKTHAVKAIKSYDPQRKTQLGSWVKTNLRKGGRYAKTYQNIGRIVEDRAGVITDFKNARASLNEQHGRPATDAEMFSYLKKQPPTSGKKKHKWSMSEVDRMNSELRADIMSSAFESDPTVIMPSLDNEIMSFLHEDLSPQEQQVFQHIKDPSKTQGKTGLIAKQLGWSPSKVSRLRKAIERKAHDYKRQLG